MTAQDWIFWYTGGAVWAAIAVALALAVGVGGACIIIHFHWKLRKFLWQYFMVAHMRDVWRLTPNDIAAAFRSAENPPCSLEDYMAYTERLVVIIDKIQKYREDNHA